MKFEIVRLAKGGAGIAYAGGKAFFIAQTLPGEVVEAEIIEEKARFGRARLVRVDVPSQARCTDTCAQKACDGCGFRHVRQDVALALKAEAVYAEIAKGARMALPAYVCFGVGGGLGLDGLRRRVRLHARGNAVGYFARESHRIVSARLCRVVDPELARAVGELEARWQDIGEAQCDIQMDLDDASRVFVHFKPVQARQARRDRHRPQARRGADAVRKSCELARLCELAQTLVTDGIVLGARVGDRVFGAQMIRDVVAPARLLPTVTWRRIGDFSQATREANAVIHERLDAFLLRARPGFVADLFSGSGNLTFRAATRVARVEACEFYCDEQAFERGKKDNQLIDASKVSLTLADLNLGLPASVADADCVVCDPARDGLSEAMCDGLCGARNVRDIFYVSCEASCLARDLARLSRAYDVASIEFIDMFAQTPHLETVAILSRKVEGLGIRD